ncbi:MAG: thioredoxin family protein [Gracilibacteraceae bacterium]|jgi:thioredoxin 1|nr:thioredoxin family protein [Gracilibacteraceae bacterium]
MIKELDQAEFEAIDKSAPMALEFYSKNCGPCKMLNYVLKDVDKQMPDFRIYQIDFNVNVELKDRLGVKGFPTILFFKDGVEVERMEGLKQRPAIIKAIEDLRG